MHIEIRKSGKKKRYYLAHSYRRGKKVRKIRVYLGSELTQSQLKAKKMLAGAKLAELAAQRERISDPFEGAMPEEELEELKTLSAKAFPKIVHLSEDEWQRFTEAFTYDTNAIEGSSVGSNEVREILERGKWPDKPKGDISEAYGVAKAIGIIRKTKEHLSLNLILDVHKTVFENSKPFAGKFRAKGVDVVVADRFGNIVHRGAPSTQVRSLLSELVRWYEKNKSSYPPIVLAAVVHNQFENIHPFQDGNGRVGRLLLNNILLKHGLPPVNIELKNRQEYYAALQAYENGHNLRPTLELMLKEYRNLKRMLKRR